MAKHIHIHMSDAREMKFGLPVYTRQELEQKLRSGEWDMEGDGPSRSGLTELKNLKTGKRFSAYVH